MSAFGRRRRWSGLGGRPGAEPTAVVILGLAGLRMHHGALGATRSAGRLGIPVLALQRGERSPVERSRYLQRGVRLPADADDGAVLQALLALSSERPQPLLLAVDDAAAMFVDDHASELRERYLLPALPSGLARRLADKRELHDLCTSHSVATPRSCFPDGERELSEDARELGFPVVLKRIDASRATVGPCPNVTVAHDHRQLLDAYAAMRSPSGGNVMLQEHIPAGRDGDWMFNGYFDRDSRPLVSFTGLKLRQSPAGAGAACLGVCRDSPPVRSQSERLMAAVGYRGPLDADYRFDPHEDNFKLLDVNPRIGASFRLFVGSDCVDVLRTMYMDLTGGKPPPTAQREGRRWLVEPQDLRTSLQGVKGGELSVRDWLRSLAGVRELAWWASDDPAPWLAMVGGLVGARVGRAARRGTNGRVA